MTTPPPFPFRRSAPRRPRTGARTRAAAALAMAVAVGAPLAAAPAPAGASPLPPPAAVAAGHPAVRADLTASASDPVPGSGHRDALTRVLDDRLADRAADVAVAVRERTTGAGYAYNADAPFAAASTVKVDLLVLLMLRAQAEDRRVTAAELALAGPMLRYSDNDAADALYTRLGLAAGYTAAATPLGLTGTAPDAAGSWGATTTTAADRLRVLDAVYADDGPLTAEHRALARDLLAGVAPEQAWGVGALGADAPAELKNGWVPRAADGGRWAVHSTGRVVLDGREYLVAVLTEGSPGYADGVALVEEVAAVAVAGVAAAIGGPAGEAAAARP
ncbi:serine hydrolase [Nocardiopsis trehalosi]|uniref:serine hydrolase n=1 Tax=Nocardiopsis trehalosi TaxID=109329 RepID=UPI00083252CB|nr:serine hydrolase [Nocardiopsis trehalosi]